MSRRGVDVGDHGDPVGTECVKIVWTATNLAVQLHRPVIKRAC